MTYATIFKITYVMITGNLARFQVYLLFLAHVFESFTATTNGLAWNRAVLKREIIFCRAASRAFSLFPLHAYDYFALSFSKLLSPSLDPFSELG